MQQLCILVHVYLGRPASDTKSLRAKIRSTNLVAHSVFYPNCLWYQLLLHHCNILTITKWLISRPFSTGLTNSGWWSSQWVAFITLVYNHHIVSSSIIADSTITKLFWSATINSYGIEETCAFWKYPHKKSYSIHSWNMSCGNCVVKFMQEI